MPQWIAAAMLTIITLLIGSFGLWVRDDISRVESNVSSVRTDLSAFKEQTARQLGELAVRLKPWIATSAASSRNSTPSIRRRRVNNPRSPCLPALARPPRERRAFLCALPRLQHPFRHVAVAGDKHRRLRVAALGLNLC